MPEPVIPQAAVEAMARVLHNNAGGVSTCGDCRKRAGVLLAAALPHLVDDAAVERAARAMYERTLGTGIPWSTATGWHLKYRRHARTALLAAFNIETTEAPRG